MSSLKKQLNREYTPVSDAEAKKYLQHFGYIQPSHVLHGVNEVMSDFQDLKDTFKIAISKFQKFVGLDVTGELDFATKKKMAEPRCGVSDVKISSTVREASFKWNKQNLTYVITYFSTDLSRDDVRSAIRKAFDTWSQVVPLYFTEIAPNASADFKIEFAWSDHADGHPFDKRGGILAHAFFPPDGRIHFDEAEHWAYMDTNKIANGYVDLLAIAIHEIGHALGLEHSENRYSIMAPYYLSTVDVKGNYNAPKLISSDIKAIQTIYGPK